MWTSIFERVGGFIKYVGALIVLIFSVSLGYTFFSHIAPANMPWFVWAAMGLTEIGLIVWLIVFRTSKANDPRKPIAFVMVFVCLIATLFTDAMELSRMFGVVTIIANMYYYCLIGLLVLHFGALVLDEFIKENMKYQRAVGIDPLYMPAYQETGEMVRASYPQTGQLPEGNYYRPLAQRSNQTGETLIQKAGYLAKGAAGMLMEKGRSYTKNGKAAGPVPGQTNETTSEDMYASDTLTAQEPEQEVEAHTEGYVAQTVRKNRKKRLEA
jgi:hypothetical protein